MKTTTAALLFFASLNAFAYDFDDWTTADKQREAVYIAVTTIDWLQTRNIARHNCTNPETGDHNCYEAGPAAMFIGHDPSVGKVNAYFASLIAAHIVISDSLKEYRATFQSVTIFVETGYAISNYRIGISAKF